MKLIFLDIDGVLNGYGEDYIYETIEGYPTSFGSTDHFLSKGLIENFNYLVAHTQAEVVVSSTWRLGESIDSMQNILDSVGIVCNVIGLTERFSHQHTLRGNEIYHWIKNNTDKIGCNNYHECTEYVILDDDSDMLLWQKDNFVQTDGTKGLTKADVWKAINILNRGDTE